jgi:ketosteroid isomerase-like protein
MTGIQLFRKMRRRTRIASHCILLLAWAAGNAQTSLRQEEEQNRIVALENAWNQALRIKDAKAVEPLMAGELIYIDYDGSVMNKAQYLESIRRPEQRVEHVVSESMQVQIFGKAASVIGVYRENGIRSGKPYSLRERFVDLWIDQNGMWLCVTSQATLILH